MDYEIKPGKDFAEVAFSEEELQVLRIAAFNVIGEAAIKGNPQFEANDPMYNVSRRHAEPVFDLLNRQRYEKRYYTAEHLRTILIIINRLDDIEAKPYRFIAAELADDCEELATVLESRATFEDMMSKEDMPDLDNPPA